MTDAVPDDRLRDHAAAPRLGARPDGLRARLAAPRRLGGGGGAPVAARGLRGVSAQHEACQLDGHQGAAALVRRAARIAPRARVA